MKTMRRLWVVERLKVGEWEASPFVFKSRRVARHEAMKMTADTWLRFRVVSYEPSR